MPNYSHRTLEQYANYLVMWLRSEVKKAQKKGIVLGVSGGIDSAVSAVLAKLAFPDNHLLVFLPCHSSSKDYECVNALVETLKLKIKIQDLTDIFVLFLSKRFDQKQEINKIGNGNLKARLRMTALYDLAQTNDYLVLGTDNYNEWYAGYFTKFGDGAYDLNALSLMLKNEVKQLAQFLKIPQMIISRAPSASLWEGQTDEQELGFSYDQFDAYLKDEVTPSHIEANIERRHLKSTHKRQLPIVPTLKLKAFLNYE